jgi:dTDP-4-dehydrorhamnose reductase
VKIAVFGADGMLGKALVAEAVARDIGVMAVYHGEGETRLRGARIAYLDISRRDHLDAFIETDRSDVWINAAGIIPPAAGKVTPADADIAMVMTNALGPQVLAAAVKKTEATRLIHVSTDCVFSGNTTLDRPYTVTTRPDPVDLYGRSKLVGEAILDRDRIAVVRTSFVGLDHGLLRWFLDESAAGHTVTAWRNAWWSGSSVYAVARALLDLADRRTPGIVHLTTSLPLSKAVVLALIRDAFGFRTNLDYVERPVIRRVLRPTVDLTPFDLAINEVAEKWRAANAS